MIFLTAFEQCLLAPDPSAMLSFIMGKGACEKHQPCGVTFQLHDGQ